MVDDILLVQALNIVEEIRNALAEFAEIADAATYLQLLKETAIDHEVDSQEL